MPLPTSGLILHLDADDLSGTLSDGDPVATWPDQSGLGNDAAQATAANRPVFKTGIINGLPAIRFGGLASDQYLIWASNPFSGATAGEIFIVLATVEDPPASSDNSGLWNISAHSNAHYPYTDGVVYDNFGTTSRKTTGNPTQDLTEWHWYNVSSAAGAWTSRINGIQHYTTPSNTVAFDVSSPWLGKSGSIFNFRGDMAAVIAYDHVLTAQDRADVEDYITQRWFTASGVQANIDHGIILGHNMQADVEAVVEVAVDHGLVLGHTMEAAVSTLLGIDVTHGLVLGHAGIVNVGSFTVVTHNLGLRPNPGEILIQPRNVDHAVQRYAVSAETESTFTVTVAPPPGAGKTFEFGWIYVPAEPSASPP